MQSAAARLATIPATITLEATARPGGLTSMFPAQEARAHAQESSAALAPQPRTAKPSHARPTPPTMVASAGLKGHRVAPPMQTAAAIIATMPTGAAIAGHVGIDGLAGTCRGG